MSEKSGSDEKGNFALIVNFRNYLLMSCRRCRCKI